MGRTSATMAAMRGALAVSRRAASVPARSASSAASPRSGEADALGRSSATNALVTSIPMFVLTIRPSPRQACTVATARENIPLETA